MSIPFVPVAIILTIIMLLAFFVVVQGSRGVQGFAPFRWPAFLVMMGCAVFLIWNLGRVIGITGAASGTG